MDIKITGQGIEVGDILKKHIHARLEESTTGILKMIEDTNVVIKKNGHHIFHCTTNVHTDQHSIVIRCQAEDKDIFTACDMCFAKIKKQLRKYHKKLVDFKHNKELQEENKINRSKLIAKKYTISCNNSAHENSDEEFVMNVLSNIVAEKTVDIDHLSTEEAMMKMDLSDVAALPFVNNKTHHMSVVYKRKDGDVSVLDLGYKIL
jgi:ribosomal subunit interface protein